MEFLEVPIYDDDLIKLLIRFLINTTVALLIVAFCYYPKNKQSSYVFTFLMMNVIVFFICFLLKKLELGLGMALGLFAIFAIIRYRTDAIRVKDMTYLFLLIGIAVINALSNKKTSYAELAFTNVMLFVVPYLLEKLPRIKRMGKQSLVYDQLELLNPSQHTSLYRDIESRIGIKVEKVKVGKIDLSKGVANVTIYYQSDDLSSANGDDLSSSDEDEK